MAEEEITELEEEDATIQDEEGEGLEPVRNKKKLILMVAGAFSLFLVILILVISLSSSDDDYSDDYELSDDLDITLNRKKILPPSELERMIKKANLLYAQGHNKEALHLFKQIATHSESISYYNLGVARMKNKKFELAMQAFKKAIAQNKKVCVSAINIAVCALKLNKKDLYKYYIDLAASKLQNEHDSPLYSYYQSLIEFYRDRPLEALASLEHKSSNYFKEEQNYLRAKIAFSLNDAAQSSTYLEEVINDDDLAALGMLYARMGNLNLAKKSLLKALDGGYDPIKNSLALAHVYLKNGETQEASSIFKKLYDSDSKNYTSIYPIKVTLNPQQFDLKKAQESYINTRSFDDQTNLEILLHYAPYKIFDAMDTLSYIKKGSANIYIDDIKSAKQYLSKAGQFSQINKVIASSIHDALEHKLHIALNKLLNTAKKHPKHAILNYNLALTYAKLGNLKKANHYFSKSYNLDAKNYLAGAFAIMTGKLIGKVVPKQIQLFNENLGKEIETANIAFVKALMAFHNKNLPGVVQWSEEQKLTTSIENSLMVLTNKFLQRDEQTKRFTKVLIQKESRNVLSQLLYIQSHFKQLETKHFAIDTLAYLKNLKLSLHDIFYASHITQKLFIDYTFVTGRLFDLVEKLKQQLAVENKNIIGILQALAYSNFYLQQFEEAYVLYNKLIDEYKEQDSTTLFNAALAATGSDHHGNAMALLELANLKNRFNPESRYALALLYLENKNYNAASIQLSKILVSNFKSKHTTFDIDINSIGKESIQVK